jgi:hypothetical protein
MPTINPIIVVCDDSLPITRSENGVLLVWEKKIVIEDISHHKYCAKLLPSARTTDVQSHFSNLPCFRQIQNEAETVHMYHTTIDDGVKANL